MERPTPGIIGVERDPDRSHRRHQNGVAHRPREFASVERSHLEMMTVEVHRMRHHRPVLHFDNDALTLSDDRAVDVWPHLIVD